jgi:hypothetical protein
MEKHTGISIISLLAVVLLFSCQEKSRVEEKTIVKDDTTITITKDVRTDSTSSTKWRYESNELKDRLDRLGMKAKQKGGELGKSMNERIDKLESERKTYHKDSTRSDFKESWQQFKQKTNVALDSLDKKVDERMDNKK